MILMLPRLALFGLFVLSLVTTALHASSGITLFDAWVDAQIHAQGIPGASIAIVKDDHILWSKTYGNVSKDALLPIGSLTKPLTAIAIMKLWQKGLLELNAPVDKYLPGFAYGSSITINQLLNHTSGLVQDPDFPYYNDLNFPKFEAIWGSLAKTELMFAPRKGWKYSNLGYAILGRIIQAVSDVPYEEYVEKNVLMPLMMQRATFSPINQKDIPVGHKLWDGSSMPLYETQGMKAAFGLYAPMHEVAHIASYFLGKTAQKSLLSPATRRYMLTSTVPVDRYVRSGLGIFLRYTNKMVLIEHASQTPGYSSYLSIDPNSGMAVVLFCTKQAHLTAWADSFVRWISSYDEENNQQIPQAWKIYEGRYRGPNGDCVVVAYNGKLVLYQPLELDALVTLVPEQTVATFRMRSEYAFNVNDGDYVRFILDESGKVKQMKIANMYFAPL